MQAPGLAPASPEPAPAPTPASPQPPRLRHTSSLYDFIKVRVVLSDGGGGGPCEPGGGGAQPPVVSYVLSRFLLARTLTACWGGLSPEAAAKVALEVKKALVDGFSSGRGVGDVVADGGDDAPPLPPVPQAALEAALFAALERRGLAGPHPPALEGGDPGGPREPQPNNNSAAAAGRHHSHPHPPPPLLPTRYRVLTAFHAARTPLLVVVCGPPLGLKSTLASRLAARLNLPHVVQTDWVAALALTTQRRRQSAAAPAGCGGDDGRPGWARCAAAGDLWGGGGGASPAPPGGTDAAASPLEAECAAVAAALAAELGRCADGGRSLVIEGLHAHAPRLEAALRAAAGAAGRRGGDGGGGGGGGSGGGPGASRPPVVVAVHASLAPTDRAALLASAVARLRPAGGAAGAAAALAAVDAAEAGAGAAAGAHRLPPLRLEDLPTALAGLHEMVLAAIERSVADAEAAGVRAGDGDGDDSTGLLTTGTWRAGTRLD